ncbi:MULTISPECIES: DNA replication terminus site-binding protein [Vibrio]|uniref:DNA replication terminus site-binding protein n=1 Tax=Vibrio TaxID=662 RepID=UPI002074CF50|nr:MULTISPECIES: DNA replication terminus site-binding protein [Vibrio]USD35533.1 hypothetical protein J8Z27_23220 [Vibrio sp. SCSIO 43186]USD72657.1 hypothetical protein J4N41_23225 [Vibrio sp. SCSIO 43139]USD98870.1 hypothetical protein CTT30_22575 [Vibrio coralliilyticus]
MEKPNCTVHSESTGITPDSIYECICLIESKTEELIKLLSECDTHHCEIAIPPKAFVDEDGHDSVYEEISSIELDRLIGNDATEAYLNHLRFQQRHESAPAPGLQISQIAARRMIGLIHLKPMNEDAKTQIENLIDCINDLKSHVKKALSDYYPNSMARTRKFYKKYVPDILPKSITRLIRFSKETVTRVHFSWLANGYSQEKYSYEEVKTIIEDTNLKLSKEIGMDYAELCEKDFAKLKPGEIYYRFLPGKINPRHRLTIREGGANIRKLPVRSVVPLLLLQNEPLLDYTPIADVRSISELQPNRNRKRVERIPVIEKLGFYKNGSAKQ